MGRLCRVTRSRHPAWCEYYVYNASLQEAVYHAYQVDYDLLQFTHPVALTSLCPRASPLSNDTNLSNVTHVPP